MPSRIEFAQIAARQADRILKGAKPGELPIEQPTRFDLAIHLRAARALGLKIPQSLLLRTDSGFCSVAPTAAQLIDIATTPGYHLAI